MVQSISSSPNEGSISLVADYSGFSDSAPSEVYTMCDKHSEAEHARMLADHESAMQDYLAAIRWAGENGCDVELDPPQRPGCLDLDTVEPPAEGSTARLVA
jgi:hypothetical protein